MKEKYSKNYNATSKETFESYSGNNDVQIMSSSSKVVPS